MKTLSVVALVAVVFAQSALALQNDKNIGTMSVSGTASIEPQATEASFHFVVEGLGPSLQDAVDEAKMKSSKIATGLLNKGIKLKDISTLTFFSGENIGGEAFLSSSRDYIASITTVVKTDSMPLLEPVVVFVSECHPKSMSNISFAVPDSTLERYKREVRMQAALKAQRKAVDVARALNTVLVSVRYVNVENTDQTDYSRAVGNAPLISISATVRVVNVVDEVRSETDEEIYPAVYVSGSSQTKVTATQATFGFVMEGLGSTLNEAIQKAKLGTSVIVKDLLDSGLKQHNVWTQSFISSENTGNQSFLSSSKDFVARIQTVVKVEDQSMLELAVLIVSGHEPKSMSNITFSLPNVVIDSLRDEARVQAAKQSLQTAQDMAAILGFEIEGAMTVNIDSESGFVVRGSRMTEVATLVDGLAVSDQFVGGLGNRRKENSLSPQKMSFRSNVSVAYGIASGKRQ